ncbi:hypothetical protein JOD82_002122 [Paenibacillus sp. 1182]|uniref:hypothetical protein n=1 Tax=Paenibacillus sp. 1182 TaxID=2806565 RepID=UPI001AE9CD32|nr:hypothetical protein [Paenibacillus sp. 1182]MBP1309102.1 hypothetical protein [Paenibacillus sp. 1182]
MTNLEQAKYQLSHLLGKAQFFAAMINLNTDGYAYVRFDPDYQLVEAEFYTTKSSWNKRTEDISGECIEISEFLLSKNETRDWSYDDKDWNNPYKKVLKTIKLLRSYNAVLESFLQDNNFDLESHPNVRPYEEMIKYTVYGLR